MNVKRIRPAELGLFDYDNENHTFGSGKPKDGQAFTIIFS